MAHRSKVHEKAYRKGKAALKLGAVKKDDALKAASEFLEGKFPTQKSAADHYEVTPMAVSRRVQYAPFPSEFPPNL